MSGLLSAIENSMNAVQLDGMNTPKKASDNNIDHRKDTKRKDYIEWEEYFMLTAKITSMRSKDPSCQVGCVIVDNERRIVGTGYNGFPVGCSDDEFPWGKGNINPLDNKYAYVVHAEANAILNKIKGDLKDTTIYTTTFPCNECAKLIIQSGIKNVVFLNDRLEPSFTASKRMFDAVKVNYRQFQLTRDRLMVCLDKSDFS